MSVIFVSLSCLSSSLKLKKNTFRVTITQGQHHVSSAQESWALFIGVRTLMGEQIRIPRVVITSSFFFPPLLKAMLKTAELPALCEVVSSISQLFVPYFAMSAFTCVYLQHRINSGTHRSNSSQSSWLFIVWNNNFDLIANCSFV